MKQARQKRAIIGIVLVVAMMVGLFPGVAQAYGGHPTQQRWVSFSAGAGGSISPESNWWRVGQSVNFAAQADSGYVIDQLNINGRSQSGASGRTSYGGSISVTNSATHSVDVSFRRSGYTISTSVSGGTISPSTSVHPGGSYTVTATALAGYKLSSVTIDGHNQPVASGAGSYTYAFSNVCEDHSISVTFEAIDFMVSTSVTGGTITPGGTTGWLGSYSVTATASEGHELASVTLNGITTPYSDGGTSFSHTFTNVQRDVSISVVFAPKLFTVSTSVTGGTITPDAQVPYGTAHTVSADAADGYALESAMVDGGIIDVAIGAPSFTHNFSSVTKAHSVSVVFSPIMVEVSTSVSGGSITDSGTTPWGENFAVTATALPGHVLKSVTINGQTTPYSGNETSFSHTFTNLQEPAEIHVLFAIKAFVVSTSVTGGSITGSRDVDWGESMPVVASANPGYGLASVTIDEDPIPVDVGATSFSYTFEDIEQNHSISVVFEKQVYHIATSVTGGSITPSADVAYGDPFTVTATPEEGYTFSSASVNDGDAAGSWDGETGTFSYTFSSVTAPGSVTVVFEKMRFTIQSTAGTGGSISPQPTVMVNYGDAAGFTMTPNSGYVIDSVTVDGSPVAAPGGQYTFANVRANHSIHVSFRVAAVPPPVFIQYTVVASADDGGSISPVGAFSVQPGASMSFTAAPKAGYAMDYLLIDGTEKLYGQSSYTFAGINGNRSIHAVFKAVITPLTLQEDYIIHAFAGEGGTIEASGNVTVAKGESRSFTISAEEGYEILAVFVDGKDIGKPASYAFTNVQRDHDIHAQFGRIDKEEERFVITASAGEGGSIDPSGAQLVAQGEAIGFTFTPIEGYRILSVVVDGADVGAADGGYTFSDVSANHSIHVSFELLPVPEPVDPDPTEGEIPKTGNSDLGTWVAGAVALIACVGAAAAAKAGRRSAKEEKG